jgi:hypothetical protein
MANMTFMMPAINWVNGMLTQLFPGKEVFIILGIAILLAIILSAKIVTRTAVAIILAMGFFILFRYVLGLGVIG